MTHWLPELGSRNLQLYFWVASYFTMFFSFSERLTLGKIAKVAVVVGSLLTLAYFLDPGIDRGNFAAGFVQWLLILMVLVLGNGVMRMATSMFRKREANRLDWIQE